MRTTVADGITTTRVIASSPWSRQTVRLGKYRHSSPEAGGCVMELASILADERFSDDPRSVSRPIAALLRRYNDRLDDDDKRQSLYVYAARILGAPRRRRADAIR
jgi:hypothetical protein